MFLSSSLLFVGLMEGMRDPICSSLIPDLVNGEEIHTGIRIRNVFDSLARLSGPGIASTLIFYKGFKFTLICGILLMLSTIISVAFLKFGKSKISEERLSLKKYFMGFKILTKIKPEIQIAILSMIINFSVVPFLMIAIPGITKNCGFSSLYLGMLEILFGIGILIGSSQFCSLLNKKIGKYQTTLVGLICTSLMMTLPPLQNFTSLSLPAALLIGGIGLSLFNININTLRLIATPENYLSRLISIVATICTITIPFGTITLGCVSHKIGINLTYSFIGLALLSLTTIYFLFFNDIRIIFSQDEIKLKGYYMNKWPDAFR